MKSTSTILAGDIGGTNTRLALFDSDGDHRHPLAEVRYRSSEHPDWQSIVETFVQGHDAAISTACLGVAGPVIEQRSRITNLGWVIDSSSFARCLGIDDGKVRLVNDVQAVATAVPHLYVEEVRTVQEGHATEHGCIGVVAPGTGLGEAYLLWSGANYESHPSEGGHASFAPCNDTETDLLRFMLQRHDYVSFERVCSGSAIAELYDFFSERMADDVDPDLDSRIAGAEDRTPLIVQHALDGNRTNPVCRHAVEMFVSILGGEAGNFALKLLTTGGIYLGGGMSPRVLSLLESPTFLSSLSHKGRFEEMVSRIPVRVIVQPDAALMGAAIIASSILSEIRLQH